MENIHQKISTESAKSLAYLNWRKRRGIKLVMTCVEWKGKKRAVALFEGNEYVGVGETNWKAMENCFRALDKNL